LGGDHASAKGDHWLFGRCCCWHKRLALGNINRVVLIGLYRLVHPRCLKALKIIIPETVIRWHRAGFRAYWG